MEEEINGLSDLGSAMDAYAPIEDLAEDYEFFGLGQFITPEMLQSHLTAAAAGAGGILAVTNLMDRIDYFADKPNGKLLTEGLVGILGGRLLWQVNRDAAMGFVGGVTGMALANLVQGYINDMQAETAANGNGNGNGNGTEGLAYTEVHDVPSYRKLDRVSVPAGWGHGRAPMSGLGRDIVTRANYMQVDGLEGESDIGGWIG